MILRKLWIGIGQKIERDIDDARQSKTGFR